VIKLKNMLTVLPGSMPGMQHGSSASGPCAGGSMSSVSTNIHFHGLNIPPTCHQDEVIKTSVEPTDPPFVYDIQIPQNDPPGLYWYHPHPHGFTTTQITGGAAGPLIIDGIEQMAPEAAGLPERVFVIRQVNLKPPPPPGVKPPDNDTAALSINFVPAFEKLAPPQILVKPSQRQLWRVVNATSIYFLALQLQVQTSPLELRLQGLDGIPLAQARNTTTVVIPPAGRAEFIVPGLAANTSAQFVNLGYDTGPDGDPNLSSLLASVVPSDSAPEPAHKIPAAASHATLKRFVNLSNTAPSARRFLYFSEQVAGDGSTKFFITVKGQVPRLYDPDEPPAIVTRQGRVEDWTIENHSQEVHAFHLHQLHFVVIEENGQPTHDPALRDTVVMPYWDGKSGYPHITVRVDFRDPETVGTFLYHCHILDHEDGGMMAKIRVLPAK